MAAIDRFQNLKCWQKARELENMIYQQTCTGALSKDFALKNQLNRASGSGMDNIAEGFGLGGNKDFIHFLIISRASIYEIQSQLYRAMDRNYLNALQFKILFDKSNEVIAFVTYLRNSERKGPRFE
jgi:four helix bundle protein